MKSGKANFNTVPRLCACVLAALAATLGALGWMPSAPAPCWLKVASGQTVTLKEDVTHCYMDVAGTLNIDPGVTLTLDGNGGATSTINGTVNLKADDGPPDFATLALVDNDHTLTGSGSIVGANSGCEIGLGSNNLDLDSQITISGALRITDAGGATSTSFSNNGKVHANVASQTIELAVDSLGAPIGDWEVSAANAVLKFSVGSVWMFGNFTVSAGTLDVDATVDTWANLTFTGGKIDVAANRMFRARGLIP